MCLVSYEVQIWDDVNRGCHRRVTLLAHGGNVHREIVNEGSAASIVWLSPCTMVSPLTYFCFLFALRWWTPRAPRRPLVAHRFRPLLSHHRPHRGRDHLPRILLHRSHPPCPGTTNNAEVAARGLITQPQPPWCRWAENEKPSLGQREAFYRTWIPSSRLFSSSSSSSRAFLPLRLCA